MNANELHDETNEITREDFELTEADQEKLKALFSPKDIEALRKKFDTLEELALAVASWQFDSDNDLQPVDISSMRRTVFNPLDEIERELGIKQDEMQDIIRGHYVRNFSRYIDL